MKKINLQLGEVYLIKVDGIEYKAIYEGRQEDFECMICGKGHNARTFNIWHNEDSYETFSFGDNHMPEIIKVLPWNERFNSETPQRDYKAEFKKEVREFARSIKAKVVNFDFDKNERGTTFTEVVIILNHKTTREVVKLVWIDYDLYSVKGYMRLHDLKKFQEIRYEG